MTTERKEPSFIMTIPSRTSAIWREFWVLLALVCGFVGGAVAVPAAGGVGMTPPTATGGAIGCVGLGDGGGGKGAAAGMGAVGSGGVWAMEGTTLDAASRGKPAGCKDPGLACPAGDGFAWFCSEGFIF